MRALSRDPGIDALRAGAALSVLAIHSGLFTHGRPTTGVPGGDAVRYALWAHLDVGVDVFFALSGYLVAGPFLRRLLDGRPLPDLRRYLIRRALRILPAYWVALAAITFVPFVPWPWWQWALHVLLLQNPFPGQLSRGLGIAWTLHVEVVFYLLVPAVCYLVRRRTGPRPIAPGRIVAVLGWGLLASMVFTVAVAFVGDEAQSVWSRPLRLSVPAAFSLFVPGMLLAIARSPAAATAWPRLPDILGQLARPRRLALVTVVVTVLVLGLNAVPALAVQDSRRLLRSVLGALVLAWLTSGRSHGRLVRGLAPLGVVSYGIYLWHFVAQRDLQLYDVFRGSTGELGFVVNVAVVLIVTLPLAAVSWFAIERPALRLAGLVAHRIDAEGPTGSPTQMTAAPVRKVDTPARSAR
ncbi:MAG: acyltransferase [Mycobacteriales bacterium]|nr:acyltransferase [Mycobacteriales bacterium]